MDQCTYDMPVTCPWHARDMPGIWIRAAMCCMPWNLLAREIPRCIAGPWEAAWIARIWLVLEEFWSILKPYDPYVFFVFFTALTLLLPKQESIVWKLICPCLCCVKMCEALICSVRRSPACVARVKNCWVSPLLNILNFGLEWLHGGRQRSAGTECHIFSVCFNIFQNVSKSAMQCTVKFKAGTSKAAGNTPGGPRTFYESDIQKKSTWDINIYKNYKITSRWWYQARSCNPEVSNTSCFQTKVESFVGVGTLWLLASKHLKQSSLLGGGLDPP